jgi:dUTP pyrophosphatase
MSIDEQGAAAAPVQEPGMPVVLGEGAILPYRAHAHDAGLDLISAEELVLPAGGRALVGTGVSAALPEGTVGLVCPRSGLAVRHGVTVLNGPGVVDAGYRGEIRVPLINLDREADVTIHPGDRIAQLVIVPFVAPRLEVVTDLEASERADRGFGSSGGLRHADGAADDGKE